MRKVTQEEPQWSVTKDGLSWLDEKGIPLQVDPVTNRLLVGAIIVFNGKREWLGVGTNPGVTPKAFDVMAAAVVRARSKGRVSREEARRIGDEALEAALKAARLGQLELPVAI